MTKFHEQTDKVIFFSTQKATETRRSSSDGYWRSHSAQFHRVHGNGVPNQREHCHPSICFQDSYPQPRYVVTYNIYLPKEVVGKGVFWEDLSSSFFISKKNALMNFNLTNLI